MPSKVKKSKRGFASMSPEAVKRIASMGGKAIVKKFGKNYMAEIGYLGGKN